MAVLTSLILMPIPHILLSEKVGILQRGSVEASNTLRAALIIHWVLIEAAFLSNAVVFLITGSWSVFGASVLAMAVLASHPPTGPGSMNWISGGGR